MKIKQHIPNSVNDFYKPLEEAEFNTYEELMEIPWVKSFGDPLRYWISKDHPSGFIKNPFIRFSISLCPVEYDLLMVEYKQTYLWEARFCVVGYLSKDCMDKLGLPIWRAPKGQLPAPKGAGL